MSWERYLDHATTSAPKAPGVPERAAELLRGICASPGRSSHRPARAASRLVTEVRAQTAEFFGYVDPHRVIFASGATAALNLALKGMLSAGDHVVATSFDHSSTLRPLARLRDRGVRVTIVRGAEPDGEFVAAVIREIRPRTKLVVVNHASNVIGSVLPYETIGRAAHERGAQLLLDAAQTAGLLAIDLSNSPVDLLVFSGHKGLLGPPGVGGLLGPGVSSALRPLIDGGTGHRSEDLYPPSAVPTSLEAGTPNTPAIGALGTALTFVSDHRPVILDAALALREQCVRQLRRLPRVQVFDAPSSEHAPLVSFRIDGVHPQRVAKILDSRFDLQVRAGLHCAPLMHQALDTIHSGGTVRASFGYGNNRRSVDLLCEAVAAVSGGN